MDEGRSFIQTRVISRREGIVEEREISHFHNRILFNDGRVIYCTDRMIDTNGENGDFDDSRGIAASGAFMGDWNKDVLFEILAGEARWEGGEFTLRGEPMEVCVC